MTKLQIMIAFWLVLAGSAFVILVLNFTVIISVLLLIGWTGGVISLYLGQTFYAIRKQAKLNG